MRRARGEGRTGPAWEEGDSPDPSDGPSWLRYGGRGQFTAIRGDTTTGLWPTPGATGRVSRCEGNGHSTGLFIALQSKPISEPNPGRVRRSGKIQGPANAVTSSLRRIPAAAFLALATLRAACSGSFG